ncbi:MAG TPA: GtrA family protein [Gaiellaceae bacterium]
MEPGLGIHHRPLLPPTLVGFAVINLGTFGLDLALLTVLHGTLHVVLPLAFTISYVSAFAVSFTLNRRFNFRSHAPVGRQLAIYAVAVLVNYLAFVLGVGTGLAALGLEYHLARIGAGLCEGAYMYVVLRWFVFRLRAPAEPAVRG